MADANYSFVFLLDMLFFWLIYIPSSIDETKEHWNLLMFHIQNDCLSTVLNS